LTHRTSSTGTSSPSQSAQGFAIFAATTSGTHPKYVQQLLGHASIQLTFDRYSHWMPSMGKHTASAMDYTLEDRDDGPENEGSNLEPRAFVLVY
jgi:hypothetical protein